MYYRAKRGRFNPHGVDAFDTDWDNLGLLDSSPYDLFESTSSLPGTLEKTTIESQ